MVKATGASYIEMPVRLPPKMRTTSHLAVEGLLGLVWGGGNWFVSEAAHSSEPGDPGLYVSQLSHPKSASSDRFQNRIPQPRGFAMKVFNVDGEMFDTGKDVPIRLLPVLQAQLTLSWIHTRY